jgi:hypothetical protein
MARNAGHFPQFLIIDLRDQTGWLGREDSNLRMAESKSAALPLGYAPPQVGNRGRSRGRSGRRNIIADSSAINDDTDAIDPAISSADCRRLARPIIISLKPELDVRGLPSKLHPLRKK